MFETNHLSCDKTILVKRGIKLFKSIDRKLKTKKLQLFFDDIILNYYDSNNFHNFRHAFEVFEVTYQLLNCVRSIGNDDKKILLISAICHDVNHLGQTNNDYPNFLKSNSGIRKSLELYEDILRARVSSYDSQNEIESSESFNEKIHIAQTISLTSKHMNSFFSTDLLSIADTRYINSTIESLILSTDLKLHSKYFSVIEKRDTSLSMMIMILKIADLSHIMRCAPTHIYWVFNIKNETHSQILNGTLKDIAEDTIFFFSTFLRPLLDMFEIKCDKKTECFQAMLNNYTKNMKMWQNYL